MNSTKSTNQISIEESTSTLDVDHAAPRPPLTMDKEFTKVGDQIFIKESTGPGNPDHPDVILIFGWGDATLRHIAKFSAGYETLFPGAKHVLIMSTISSIMSGTLAQRTSRLETLRGVAGRRTLVHTMSNTGAITYAGFLNAHSTIGKPFPHDLLVLDSTPGTPYLSWDSLKRWSWAMTIGTAKFFPWPRLITQMLWALFICINTALQKIRRRQSAAIFARTIINDSNHEGKADKLFLYGKKDELIAYTDIEEYAAESREKGYHVEMVEFDSGHVEHMRKNPDRYWDSIGKAWEDARRRAI